MTTSRDSAAEQASQPSPSPSNGEAATRRSGMLVLEDGSVFRGRIFGHCAPSAGEVVFNTGMVGYHEALTDPSYRGQVLALTYPLVGNYGVPVADDEITGASPFESPKVQVSGLIVSELSSEYSHWSACQALDQWLRDEGVIGLSGIDTRQLTKRLRESGVMLGKVVPDEQDTEFVDPNRTNLVAEVSVSSPVTYPGGSRRVVLVDCGCKAGILRNLLARGVTVIRVPWDYDFLQEDFDGLVISNGPGNPEMCGATVGHLQRALAANRPTFGICLGNQLLALAVGARTYKLKFGHRGQNQPCIEVGTRRCYITSQNHGYAVDVATLPSDWEPWFTNANDGTNEGLRHKTKPFMSVQFHPEGAPGPFDTDHLFDAFVGMLR